MTDEAPPTRQPQIDAIIQRATDITDSIRKLTTEIDRLTRIQNSQIAKIRRINLLQAAVVTILMVFVVMSFWQITKIERNAEQIDVLQDLGGTAIKNAVAEQQRRKEIIFCPILAQALSTYDPSSRAAMADPSQYQRMFGGLERAAEYMECLTRSRASVLPPAPAASPPTALQRGENRERH